MEIWVGFVGDWDEDWHCNECGWLLDVAVFFKSTRVLSLIEKTVNRQDLYYYMGEGSTCSA